MQIEEIRRWCESNKFQSEEPDQVVLVAIADEEQGCKEGLAICVGQYD